MKYLSILALLLSFNVLSAPNSIIAIVGEEVITYDSIADKINKNTTKAEKLALIDQQIDQLLQGKKIQELGIKPKAQAIEAVLLSIAKKNNLTLEQLQLNRQFEEIVERISQELSLKGLRELVLQRADIAITQEEINKALEKNPVDINSAVKIKQIKFSKITINSAHKATIDNQIKNGIAFSEIIKQYPKKAVMMSDWVEINKLPEPLQSKLSQLKLHETSMPFKMGKDWQIVQLTSQREINQHTLKIIEQLSQSKLNDFFQEWVKKLRKKDLYIEIFEHKL